MEEGISNNTTRNEGEQRVEGEEEAAGQGKMKEGGLGLVLAPRGSSWKTAAVVGRRRGRNATSGHMTPLDQPATLLSSYFRLVARVRTTPRPLFLLYALSASTFVLSFFSINARHHKSVTKREKQTPDGRLFFDFR